ncbi:hypothetical protein D5S17_22240 [Pseudonocardiaceae bacterium YIM PH 21723]|nr:hypothetical protein D5S17_22240 [Pseudonocardiaceae bacterium YIM PH 21723]
MKTEQLLDKLSKKGLDGHVLPVERVQPGGGPDANGIFLTQDGNNWVVGLYDGRGNWTPAENFNSEERACQWIYGALTAKR